MHPLRVVPGYEKKGRVITMKSITCALLACALALAAVQSLSAGLVAIPGLYTTGVDDDGNVLPGGAVDTHYHILETGTDAIVVSTPAGSWIPNDGTSMWVWQQANGQPTNVTRTFRLTFDLTGLDPSTASISGTWATDNTGLNILINGQSTGNTSGGFTSYSNFAVTSGFIAGINTLDFIVQDFGVIAGFRVGSISGIAATVPAPGAAALLIGLGMIGGRRRR
jgi:hypothetical protein